MMDGHPCILSASQNGKLDIVRYLVDACQVDVTMMDNDGFTAFHLTSGKGHLIL